MGLQSLLNTTFSISGSICLACPVMLGIGVFDWEPEGGLPLRLPLLRFWVIAALLSVLEWGRLGLFL